MAMPAKKAKLLHADWFAAGIFFPNSEQNYSSLIGCTATRPLGIQNFHVRRAAMPSRFAEA